MWVIEDPAVIYVGEFFDCVNYNKLWKILKEIHYVPFVYFCFYFQYSGRWVMEDPAVIYVGECFASLLL